MRAVARLFCLLLVAVSAQASEFSSLEERMSDAEFRGAGLDKLSAEELANLNNWLKARLNQSTLAAGPAPQDRMGFRQGYGEDRRDFTARVVGEFSGWSKGTVLKLDNGQWWEITESTSFDVPTLSNPGVRIEPALMGSWLLKVEGYNRSVRVTRIR
jgi:hypothetical protein